MSASHPIPIPNRSGADSPGLFGRDSKRKRGDSHRQLPDPTSTVSLPAPPSVRSSMTQFSDSHHVEVGSMDILSPRPKLRYSMHGQYPSGALRSSVPSRSDSRKERPFSRKTIDEANTIDEYADGMDAKTLRELMERDQRRKERRRKTDSDRARHKLEREAARRGGGEPNTARRRRKDAETRQSEDPAIIGSSGTKKEYAVEPAEQIRPVTAQRVYPAEDPFADANAQSSVVEAPSVLQQTHPDPIPTIPYSATAEESPPVTPIRHVRQQSSLSQSTDPRTGSFQDLSKTVSEGRRSSRLGTSRRTGALSALFRRSGIGKRDSQPTFSNTSRESMGARYTPPPDNSERTYRRVSSGMPIRTKSKFRENLDDEPEANPDMYPRPPTPDMEAIPPLPSEQGRFAEAKSPSRSQRESYDSTYAPSAALLSQSLASVDSEGSWLSGGRPKKRASQQMSLGRSSLAQRPSTLEGPSVDDLGIYEETPGRRNEGLAQQSQGSGGVRSAMAIEADDDGARSTPGLEEGEEQVIEGQVSRRPTVVHRQPRIHSSEGLLRDMLAEDPYATVATPSEQYETADEATPEQTTPEAVAELQNATQGYGLTHARSISAGSARLLDIPSRRESWRRSAARTPSPTFEDRPSNP